MKKSYLFILLLLFLINDFCLSLIKLESFIVMEDISISFIFFTFTSSLFSLLIESFKPFLLVLFGLISFIFIFLFKLRGFFNLLAKILEELNRSCFCFFFSSFNFSKFSIPLLTLFTILLLLKLLLISENFLESIFVFTEFLICNGIGAILILFFSLYSLIAISSTKSFSDELSLCILRFISVLSLSLSLFLSS